MICTLPRPSTVPKSIREAVNLALINLWSDPGGLVPRIYVLYYVAEFFPQFSESQVLNELGRQVRCKEAEVCPVGQGLFYRTLIFGNCFPPRVSEKEYQTIQKVSQGKLQRGRVEPYESNLLCKLTGRGLLIRPQHGVYVCAVSSVVVYPTRFPVNGVEYSFFA